MPPNVPTIPVFETPAARYPARNAASSVLQTKPITFGIVGSQAKSTIANLIPRFYNHSSGNILIDGTPISEFSLDYLRSQISIVNQSPSLFNDTISKNIAYGDDEIDVDKLKETASIMIYTISISKRNTQLVQLLSKFKILTNFFYFQE